MTQTPSTTLERIHDNFAVLTPAERQLAAHIQRNYPVAGLASITALAKEAGVSGPTVVRLVQKIGFKGYPDFQSALRGEVEQQLVSPLAKHDRWTQGVPDSHILNRFADAVLGNLQATLSQIDHAEFDAAAALLADPNRQIYAIGGRITHAIAEYFTSHMQVVRGGAHLIDAAAANWPSTLLDMKPGDVLFVFDIRRYENSVLQLVELAAARGLVVVLVTDQWISPASTHAKYRFAAHVEAPSAWDSTSIIMVLVETLLAAVQNLTWDTTRARMKQMEEIYSKSRFFRRSR